MDGHSHAYAGSDLGTARRFARVLLLAGMATAALLIALFPPTETAGPLVGWAVVIVVTVLSVAWVAAMTWRPRIVTFGALLATAYVSLAGVVVLQWLAGGRESPYHELFILPLIGVAMVHPPRRTAVFFAVVCVAMVLPQLYAPVDGEAGGIAAQLAVWAAVTAVFQLVMGAVRAQRVGLKDDARRDSLTGLQNRRAFDEAIDAAAVTSARTGEALALAVLDLDGFKDVNDRFGHPEGDACLVAVAGVLDSGVRGVDATFRWGGDEFAALLRGTDATGAADVCARLVGDLADAHPLPDGTRLRATCGIASFAPGMTPSALVAAADDDLLAGKSLAGHI
jgi:diguanylate cyclase (GGDEF)-like protein